MKNKLCLVGAFLLLATPVFASGEITINGQRADGHIVQDEGTTVSQRPYVNFTGAGVSCADVGGKTVCTIGAGGSVSIQANGSQIIATATTVNFATGLTVTETPSGTAQVEVIPTVGSDTQVMFFDGDNTPSGDSGMTYNKTTDILSVTMGITAGAATGVTVTGVNGTVTFQGAGDDQDENFKMDLNGTANTNVVTSPSSGLTKFDFQGIALQVDTEAYDDSGWDADDTVPTKDAVRDEVENARSPRCVIYESLAAADDNKSMGSFSVDPTITSSWCICHGTCTTTAKFRLEDGSGNLFTMAEPTCVVAGNIATAYTVTTDTVAARESMRFDVTNAVSPETDTYEYCVSWH